jgi:hypothetical protein
MRHEPKKAKGASPPRDALPESSAATTQADGDSLPINSAYCVLAHTPHDRTYRRLFLSLHSAVQAVERTRKRGLKAELILCRLVPIGVTDLDIDGGDQQ